MRHSAVHSMRVHSSIPNSEQHSSWIRTTLQLLPTPPGPTPWNVSSAADRETSWGSQRSEDVKASFYRSCVQPPMNYSLTLHIDHPPPRARKEITAAPAGAARG